MAVDFQTSTTGSGTGSSFSANPPAGLSSGDCWIVVVAQNNNDITVEAPAGWEVIDASFNTTWPDAGVVMKPNCTGSETAQTINITGGSAVLLYHSIRLSGQNTTDPLDAVAEFQLGGSGTTIDAPDITVAENNSLAILVAVINTGGTTTPPSGTTEIADTTDGSALVQLATAYEARNTGSYSPGDWTFTIGNAGRAALTFSIQPPPSAQPFVFLVGRLGAFLARR